MSSKNKFGTSFYLTEGMRERLRDAAHKARLSQTALVSAGLEEVLPRYEQEGEKKKDDNFSVANISSVAYDGTDPNSPNTRLHVMLDAILASQHARSKAAIYQNIAAFYELVCTSRGSGMDDDEMQQRIAASWRATHETLGDEMPSGGTGDAVKQTPHEDKGGGGGPRKGSPVER